MANRKPGYVCSASFLLKGLNYFTKQAYISAASKFKNDIPSDLKGKTFMVTGANSGIGKAATKDLLERGATVHMACRSLERATKAREELLKETKANKDNAIIHTVDMSSLRQVKAFARSFSAGNHPLDGLVNNAGCMTHKDTLTGEGFESNFAINTLGTFTLTMELLPALGRTPATGSYGAPSRVVTVSSGGAYTQKLDAKNLETRGFTDGTYIYAQNKRQQVAMTEKWAAIPSKTDRKIFFSCMHPGWADTPSVRTSMPDFHARFINKLRTPKQGADTITWLLCSATPLSHTQGEFYLDRTVQPKHLWGAGTSNTQKELDTFYSTLSEMSTKGEPGASDMKAYAYLCRDSDLVEPSKL